MSFLVIARLDLSLDWEWNCADVVIVAVAIPLPNAIAYIVVCNLHSFVYRKVPIKMVHKWNWGNWPQMKSKSLPEKLNQLLAKIKRKISKLQATTQI